MSSTTKINAEKESNENVKNNLERVQTTPLVPRSCLCADIHDRRHLHVQNPAAHGGLRRPIRTVLLGVLSEWDSAVTVVNL